MERQPVGKPSKKTTDIREIPFDPRTRTNSADKPSQTDRPSLPVTPKK